MSTLLSSPVIEVAQQRAHSGICFLSFLFKSVPFGERDRERERKIGDGEVEEVTLCL